MQSINDIKQTISPILTEYDVIRADLFGSYASGKASVKSDIDLIVSLKRPIGLLKFFELNNRLEAALGKKVDLATPGSINPHLSLRIKNTLIPIYEG